MHLLLFYVLGLVTGPVLGLDGTQLTSRLLSLVLWLCTAIGLIVCVFVLSFTLCVSLELFSRWIYRVVVVCYRRMAVK